MDKTLTTRLLRFSKLAVDPLVTVESALTNSLRKWNGNQSYPMVNEIALRRISVCLPIATETGPMMYISGSIDGWLDCYEAKSVG